MDSKLALYIVKRLTLAVITIFLIITITFFVMHEVPGGPFLSEKAPSAAVTAALEAKYGLDKPKSEQFVTYLKGIMKGDFGPSIKQRGREVTTVIMQGFKVSFKLGGTAAAIALAIGIVLGSIAAIFHNRIIDKIIMVVTTGLVAMPSFIIATLLLLVFCVWMGIFPANGNEPGGLVLPIISLSLYPMSYTTRLTRSSMLDVLGQDYIRTARAKGVKPGKVLFKHALRNAVTPVVTYAGPFSLNISFIFLAMSASLIPGFINFSNSSYDSSVIRAAILKLLSSSSLLIILMSSKYGLPLMNLTSMASII
jgi:oligopeptide transport system permease protein